ncbi:hypothetical protein OB905_13395 [Halobacteria archaeon AArc-dxtr1]|nr:hypothetical protein [Halobacteria archaeon AArc-dxtr1]
MNRRSLLASGIGGLSLATAGCLDALESDEFEPTREAACSHVPDDAEPVSHTLQTRSADPGQHVLEEADEPFAMIRDADHLEARFTDEQIETLEGVSAIFEQTDFAESVVLLWEYDIPNQSREVEFLDVVWNGPQEVTAYGCRHQVSELGPEAHTSHTCVVRIDAPELTTANLTIHSKSAGSDLQETTYTDTIDE